MPQYTIEQIDAVYDAVKSGNNEELENKLNELALLEGAEGKIDWNQIKIDGWTVLHAAAYKGHTDTFTKLVEEYGLDPKITCNDGWTVLHSTAAQGHTETFFTLVKKHNLDPKVIDKDGWTVLHAAAYNGRTDTFLKLVKKYDLDPKCTDNNGWTVLHSTASNNQTNTFIKLVEEYKLAPQIIDAEGWTVLHAAATFGHTDTFIALLERYGLDPNAKDNSGQTALDLVSDESLKADLIERIKKLPPLSAKQEVSATSQVVEEASSQAATRKRGSSAFRVLATLEAGFVGLTTRVRNLSTTEKKLEEARRRGSGRLQVLESQTGEHTKRIDFLQQTVEVLTQDVGALTKELEAVEGLDKKHINQVLAVVQQSRGLLEQHTHDLQEIAQSYASGKEASTAMQKALNNEKAQEYYLNIIRLLNGVYAASSSVNSGWVANSKSGKIGNFGTIVKIAGGFSPVAPGIVSAVGDLIQTIGKQFHKEELVKFVKLCSSPVDMDNIAKTVALTLVQEGRAHENAGKDVAAILNAVFKGKITAVADHNILAQNFVEAVTGKKIEVALPSTAMQSVKATKGNAIDAELQGKITARRNAYSDAEESDYDMLPPSASQVLSPEDDAMARMKFELMKEHNISEADYEMIIRSERVTAILKHKKAQATVINVPDIRRQILSELDERFTRGTGLHSQTGEARTEDEIKKVQNAAIKFPYVLPFVFINVQISDLDKATFQVNMFESIRKRVVLNPEFGDYFISPKTKENDIGNILKQTLKDEGVIVGGSVNTNAINDTKILDKVAKTFEISLLEKRQQQKESTVSAKRW